MSTESFSNIRLFMGYFYDHHRKYSFHEPGFLRMSPCGWRLVFINTRKHRPCFTDRLHGWRLGRFLVRISPP